MTHSYNSLNLLTMLVVLALALMGCASRATATSTPTFAAATDTPTATSTPVVPKDVMILSVEEHGYAHLFAYIPAQLTLTRLTSGNWSDIDPAMSPDGKRIAFASNRDGHWNLYTLDFQSGNVVQLTHDNNYNSAPTWSPDLAWLAYETFQNGNLQIALLSLTDAEQKPIILTSESSMNDLPAWAPNGRQIAFISNRSGDDDVWLADLDKTGPDRYTDISQTPQAAETHPVWNSSGTQLAWAASASQNVDDSGIYVWDATQPNRPAKWIGDGDWPAWNTRGDEIAAGVTGANQQLITAYTTGGNPLLLPTSLPGSLRGLIWPNIALPNPLPKTFQQAAAQTPPALWVPAVTPVGGLPAQRQVVVPLASVEAPYPQLHQLAVDSFNALRQRIIQDAGWDALASLENAFVPLTTALDPDLGQDWLYTGRAFALNSLMINAGWMSVVREDIGSQTYWRLYIRAQKQDGSEGAPIEASPWDLNARYNLDPVIYEAGGKYGNVPAGYWVDFTLLAQAYSWERLPALPNWRNYYAGARFNEFALTDGLDWYSAMLQLYPPDALNTATPVLPPTLTPSITPIPSRTPAPTNTPRITFTPSSTFTPPPPTATP
ncbi:MAG TPA: DPP IV N-terminal domain-containing protein [Anaerolineales bacterium]|nr:DPP IV N-terminal domain-containing protein [Anaerolineales bacterium]